MREAAAQDAWDSPFLIIAGVSRAGTTSLFSYLSQHPQVCACRIKEPGFFLPAGLPPPAPKNSGRMSLMEYQSLFPGRTEPNRLMMEASTLYFSIAGVADRLVRTLPNARVVVSLRDPIDRLRSAFEAASSHRWLPPTLTFESYALEALAKHNGTGTPFLFGHPLNEGLYSRNLKEWQARLGHDKVLPLWFDDLGTAPHLVARRVARFAALDSGFFETFTYRKIDPFGPRRSSLDKFSDLLRKKVRAFLPGRTPAIRALQAFYRDDVAELGQVIGQMPPWAARYV